MVKQADNFNQEQLQRAEGFLNRSAIETAGGTETVTGQPGGTGFGTNEAG